MKKSYVRALLIMGISIFIVYSVIFIALANFWAIFPIILLVFPVSVIVVIAVIIRNIYYRDSPSEVKIKQDSVNLFLIISITLPYVLVHPAMWLVHLIYFIIGFIL